MPVDKGAQLNKKVWTLFEKAGFQTKPNSTSTAEHEVELALGKKRRVDLLASAPDLGITIIGSNKSGGVKGSWTAHINDYEEIGRKAKASKVLFVVTGKELDDADINYVKQKNMALWGEEDLAYFEAVAEAIHGYAKYEIIHTLGLRTREEKQIFRALAIRILQPDIASPTQLFMFTIPPEHLLKTCVIYRRAQGNSDAYQRMLNKKRLPQIRDFVTKPGAILPTNIIVHLSDKVTVDQIKDNQLHDSGNKPITLSKASNYDLVVLNIPMEYASLELIDGQHRLYGFTQTEPATRKSFNLVVLGIYGLDRAQRQDTFVAINDNSRRMDPNLVAYLRYTDDDFACQKDNALMAIRLVVNLNRTTPFKNAIRLLDVGEQRITLKGFSGYDLKGLLGPRGLLRKHYPDNKPVQYLQALRIYFSTIRTLFKKEWDNPHRYIIATNRGVSAFLKLLKSILRTEKSQVTPGIAKKYLSALRDNWKTWELDKLSKSYVGSQGWKDFHRDLIKAIQKEYPDFTSQA
jgi:DNA sulfur modification protein DndB